MFNVFFGLYINQESNHLPEISIRTIICCMNQNLCKHIANNIHLLAIEGQSRRRTSLAACWHLECKIRGLDSDSWWLSTIVVVQGMQGPFKCMKQVQQLTLKIFQSLSIELQFQTVQWCIMMYKDVRVKACRSIWKSLLEASTNWLNFNRRNSEKQLLIDRYIAD